MNLLDLARSTPAADSSQRPSEATAAELSRLINIVLDTASAGDRREALEIALGDPENALTCLRTLLHQRALLKPPKYGDEDTRRTCRQCRRLSDRGQCRAADAGIQICGAAPYHHPAAEVLRRCEGFLPHPKDEDQRAGPERWPGIDSRREE
jgi:hypothetical protein